MLDYPRLRTPVLLAFAALAFAIAAWRGERLPEWARLFCAAAALILTVTGALALADWLAHAFAERSREISEALVFGPRSLAMSLNGLTEAQTQIVRQHDLLEISAMLSNQDDGPVWYLRCFGGVDVPMGFVDLFIEKSKETYPFLWPVRDCDELCTGGENYGSALTQTIVIRDFAYPAAGSRAAKLKIPLSTLAKRLGVGN